MTKLIATFSLIIYCSDLFGQSLERQVIGSSGGYSIASWGSLSSTSGEPIKNTFTNTSHVLTQGFQQPNQSDLKTSNVTIGITSIEVFPNPADDKINVVINFQNSTRQYSAGIVDLLGQKIFAASVINVTGKKMSISFDLKNIASATYYIVVTDEQRNLVKTFKFTKTK